MDNKETYFAAEEDPKEVAAYLDRKAKSWFDSLVENNYLQKIRRSWDAYHGYYYEDSHKISFGGETGELVNFAINHYRNLARHTLTMVSSTRPSFQPRSVNSDHKTQVQTTLAHGLLEYYMRERRLERYLKIALEYAIVLGSGYVKMEWNSTKGELVDYIEPDPVLDEEGEELRNEDGDLVDENGKKLEGIHQYEGDLEFSNLSPYDVVFDSTKESSTEHDWIITRTFKNKFDVAAKFPELREEILAIPTKEENMRYRRISLTPYDETVDIPVYEFFHKRTEAMPEGRYMLYLDNDLVLLDTPMPYRNLPVYRISPSDILGTGYGYTDMFDLLPMQDAFNSLASTVLTNQNAFGVQNILNPRGNDISVNQLESGLNFIEYNAQAGEPKPLNLTNTPAEIFNFMQTIERLMETVSGVNSVARGNADVGNLRSGNALALVQSQALQFMSGLQQSYVQLIEDVGTGLIELLQDFAEVPRVAQISGVSNKTKMKYFKGDDLSSINRVIVDVGNALAQTTAGRSEIATNLIQMGLINTPEQYLAVLNTGKLEVMTEGQNSELLLIKAENERLIDGEVDVMAVDTDNHALHIREHKNVLADPDSRLDPDLLARTLAHIQEHIDALKQTDPDLLAITGQQPLAPQPPAGAPGAAGPMQPPVDTMQAPVDVPQPAEPPMGPDGQSLLPSERPLGS